MQRTGRHLVSAVVAALGTVFVFGLVLAMNDAAKAPDDDGGSARTSFKVEPPTKKKPPKKKKRKQKKKKSKKPPPPAPIVGSNLSGLSFGLDNLAGADIGTDADSLLGDTTNVVMTEESVDDGPKPIQRVPPQYPERARKKGITGQVVLSLLISATGSVQDIRVMESRPAGVFDEAAKAAVRQWRFQPATYEGRPVAIRVTLPMSFGFEG